MLISLLRVVLLLGLGILIISLDILQLMPGELPGMVQPMLMGMLGQLLMGIMLILLLVRIMLILLLVRMKLELLMDMILVQLV